jgi:hypothetical protein
VTDETLTVSEKPSNALPECSNVSDKLSNVRNATSNAADKPSNVGDDIFNVLPEASNVSGEPSGAAEIWLSSINFLFYLPFPLEIS